MQKQIIKTDKAPAPIGPYNQAVKVGDTLYVSGQIAIDPSTGDLVNTDIQAETQQVMKNLKNVIEAGGGNLEEVIKTTIFIKNMNDFAKINEVYAQYFNEETAPARETVEVANLPKFVNVEIGAIVLVHD